MAPCETRLLAVGSRSSDVNQQEPEDPDAELMLRFGVGDEEAFTLLVRRYQGRIVSLAMRYLGNSADAEDLAQEVFLRVYRARETYTPSARFSTWIYRVTVNASLNLLRGRKVRRRVSAALPTGPGDEEPAEFADHEAETAHEKVEKKELAVVLRQIVDDLPERQRMALLLNKYEDQSYEDTAAAMDLSVSAVKSLLTRARLNVKERLVPYLAEGLDPQLGAEPEA